MTDHTRNALVGLRSALREIVAPGIGEGEPLAKQELAMVVRYLGFLEQRVELLRERAVFELLQADGLARRIIALGSERAAVLEGLVADSGELLESAEATVADLSASASALNAAISQLLEDANQDGDEDLLALERATVDAAEEATWFERAWYAPLGMDHFADELPQVEDLLTGMRSGRAAL